MTNGMPSSLTPRLVRSEVESRLGVPSGTLDLPAYKALVKRTIHDAMVCTSLLLSQDCRRAQYTMTMPSNPNKPLEWVALWVARQARMFRN
jgi:hypothetical protein